MSRRRSQPGGLQRSESGISQCARSLGFDAAPQGPRGRHIQNVWWISGGLVLLGIFLWAYWPTLMQIVRAWRKEPDYSHGYLVVPLALLFLWFRRDKLRQPVVKLAWGGLALIGLSIAVRYVGALYFLGSVDGWSILLWFAGVAWILGGWQILRWALPSIAFLWFMIPLPYRAERLASLPLQEIAANLSCWILQCLGQTALAEGTTILLGESHLEVDEACSGLRIFVGIIALAFAYVVLMRRPIWEQVALILSILPIALLVNALRIVTTGLLTQYFSSDLAHKFSHDFAGWAMIPLAAAMFGFVVSYLSRLWKVCRNQGGAWTERSNLV